MYALLLGGGRILPRIVTGAQDDMEMHFARVQHEHSLGVARVFGILRIARTCDSSFVLYLLRKHQLVK